MTGEGKTTEASSNLFKSNNKHVTQSLLQNEISAEPAGWVSLEND